MKEVHVAFASFVCAPCPFADFLYVIGYVATVCLACTSMYLQHCAFAGVWCLVRLWHGLQHSGKQAAGYVAHVCDVMLACSTGLAVVWCQQHSMAEGCLMGTIAAVRVNAAA